MTLFEVEHKLNKCLLSILYASTYSTGKSEKKLIRHS